MVDVLEMARARRNELIGELERIEWFVRVADDLQQARSSLTPLPSYLAAEDSLAGSGATLATNTQEVVDLPVGDETEFQRPPVQASDNDLAMSRVEDRIAQTMQSATESYGRPQDTVLFKKLLIDLRNDLISEGAVPYTVPPAKTAVAAG